MSSASEDSTVAGTEPRVPRAPCVAHPHGSASRAGKTGRAGTADMGGTPLGEQWRGCRWWGQRACREARTPSAVRGGGTAAQAAVVGRRGPGRGARGDARAGRQGTRWAAARGAGRPGRVRRPGEARGHDDLPSCPAPAGRGGAPVGPRSRLRGVPPRRSRMGPGPSRSPSSVSSDLIRPGMAAISGCARGVFTVAGIPRAHEVTLTASAGPGRELGAHRCLTDRSFSTPTRIGWRRSTPVGGRIA